MRPLIVFDFDGTLADSVDALIDALNDVAKRHGYRGMAEAKAVRTLSTRKLLKELGVPFWRAPGLLSEWRAAFGDNESHVAFHKGIPAALRRLEKRADLAVVSSNHVELIERVLKKARLRSLFVEVLHGGFFTKNRTFKRLLRDRKLRPDRMLYVCDETRDIHAARRAHIASCAVTWGMQDAELLLEARPSMIASDTDELLRLCRAWLPAATRKRK